LFPPSVVITEYWAVLELPRVLRWTLASGEEKGGLMSG
jgi:hypothetical protein